MSTNTLCCVLVFALIDSSVGWSATRKPEINRDKAARAKFVEATKSYNLGQFEAALKSYKEAYDLKPHPGFLFNIAQCYRHLGQYDKAAFYYRRYRNEAELSVADTTVIQDLIREVETKQETLELQERAEAEAVRQREFEIARAAALKAEAEAEEKRRAQVPFAPTVIASPQTPPPPKDSILTKWWFWTGVGVVASGAVLYLAIPVHPRDTTLGSVNAR